MGRLIKGMGTCQFLTIIGKRLGTKGFDLVDAFLSMSPAELLEAHRKAQEETAPKPLDPQRCINFIGLPSPADMGGYQPEWTDVLDELGVVITGNFPASATLDDWRGVRFPAVTFVLDRSLYPKTINALEKAGQRVVDVPLPVGIGPSEAFYKTIGRELGLEAEVEAAIAPRKEAALAHAAAFAERHGGLRMAMGLRQLNNYRTDQLAQQGLGDFAALSEFGFAITLMVQGPPEKEAKFAKLFQAHGVTNPFEVFPEPWNLSAHLGGGRFDIAYLADHCRGEARKAGVPMIVSRTLFPGFSGVDRNARAMRERLENLL